MKIKAILEEKGIRKNIVSVTSDTKLKDVAITLCEHGVGALLVKKPGTEPPHYIGIVSERDLLRIICTDDDFRTIPVEHVMTRDMIIAKGDDPIEYVMQIMTQKHIRHIPVVENRVIIGILSIRDVVNSLLTEKNLQIRHLSDYVGNMEE